ncbi:phosphoserine phosphatase RsbX [Lysinibacillus alkalisoli]|uniref:Phosphoserine phosphatase RsbX n=1 Tax=Lysinibacillus alkalisoli TaxID=1911548 RepID=A0A917G640_9BACI|nr:SpoIIE family protein phosphatase [Lysinibacillus alkalisoli]GGG24868.1 phosphoserine phosphatase RsbX [Lysinibacillus alkalisoli]
MMSKVEVAVHHTAKEHNTIIGDAYYIGYHKDFLICGLIDGLGSGEGAHQSAIIMTPILKAYAHESVEQLMLRCHRALYGKRGAAIAIAKIYITQRIIEYSSVGNIQFYLFTNQKLIYPIPQAGFLSGRGTLTAVVERMMYQRNARLFIHTDGIAVKSPKKLLVNYSTPKQIIEIIKESIDFSDDATGVAISLP